jgi:hypothetical protein
LVRQSRINSPAAGDDAGLNDFQNEGSLHVDASWIAGPGSVWWPPTASEWSALRRNSWRGLASLN